MVRYYIYSLLITFFFQDGLPHLGQRMYLVLWMCMARNTLLYRGICLCPHFWQT